MSQPPRPQPPLTDDAASHQSPQDILTVGEAAGILRVSRSTVWRWCQNGTLRTAFKVGRNWRLRRAEVEEIMG